MITIPAATIAAIPYQQEFASRESLDALFYSLNGETKRDWFSRHAYFCLPLVIGNQYGFALRSLYDFSVVWNGGNATSDLVITIADEEKYIQTANLQSVSSHFGIGIITVQTAFILRTPPGVNLMTVNPPNYFIDGLYHMTGVVEADNLRRDFTFNIKMTRPNYEVRVKRGDIIGCIMPYPRAFIDNFEIQLGNDIFTPEQIAEEQQCAADFAAERSGPDQQKRYKNGRRYFRGEDVYGNKFKDHQTHIRPDQADVPTPDPADA